MTINYIGAFFLIVIGLAIIVLKSNLIKIVIGMGILDSGINLLLISIGYRTNGTAPIFTDIGNWGTVGLPLPNNQ